MWEQPHTGWKMGQLGAVAVPCRCQEPNPSAAEPWGSGAVSPREGTSRRVPGLCPGRVKSCPGLTLHKPEDRKI